MGVELAGRGGQRVLHEAEGGVPAWASVERRLVRRGESRGAEKDLEKSQRGGGKPDLVKKVMTLCGIDTNLSCFPSVVVCKLSSANKLWVSGLFCGSQRSPVSPKAPWTADGAQKNTGVHDREEAA